VLLETDTVVEETWVARESPNNWIGGTSSRIQGEKNHRDRASIHRSM